MVRRIRATLSATTRVALPALAFGAAACTKPPARPARAPVSVSVTPVRRMSLPYSVESNGTVTPMQSGAVASQVDGIVTDGLLVRSGNLVRANGGSALVVINQVRPILVRFSVPGSQLPMILTYGAKGGLPVRAAPSSSAMTPQAPVPPSSPPLDGSAANG